jgi:hypothetical protein
MKPHKAADGAAVVALLVLVSMKEAAGDPSTQRNTAHNTLDYDDHHS